MPRKTPKNPPQRLAAPPPRRFAPLGPISEGTLREEDLLAPFSSTLAALDPSPEEQNIIEQAEALLVLIDNDWFSELEPHISPSAFLNEELFDALQAHAAPFCHFGSHEGDGACFGFWFDSEAFEEAVAAGEVIKVAAGVEWKVYRNGEVRHLETPEGKLIDPAASTAFEYIAEVSDHGNLTLFDLEGRELLSVA